MRKFLVKKKLELMETGACPIDKNRAESNSDTIDVHFKKNEK